MKTAILLLSATLATLAAEPLASAQEARPFEVVVKPAGQPWSIGDHGARMDCNPTCTMRLTPKQYRISMGTTAEDVLLDGPSEIAYRPPVLALRFTGGALLGTGLVAGGILTASAALVCAGTTTTNPDGTVTYTSNSCTKPVWSRTTQHVLIGVAAGSFAAAVVGGILFYLGGESIRVRDSRASPERIRALAPDVRRVRRSGLGGVVDAVLIHAADDLARPMRRTSGPKRRNVLKIARGSRGGGAPTALLAGRRGRVPARAPAV
ncbi:MAG: hypothetical protein QM820_60615 [Minicystis sp.]